MKKFLSELFRFQNFLFFLLFGLLIILCVLSCLFLVNTDWGNVKNWDDLESQPFFYLIPTLAVVLLIFLFFLIRDYNSSYQGKITGKGEKEVKNYSSYFSYRDHTEYWIRVEKDKNVIAKRVSEKEFKQINYQDYVKKMPGSFKLIVEKYDKTDSNAD